MNSSSSFPAFLHVIDGGLLQVLMHWQHLLVLRIKVFESLIELLRYDWGYLDAIDAGTRGPADYARQS